MDGVEAPAGAGPAAVLTPEPARVGRGWRNYLLFRRLSGYSPLAMSSFSTSGRLALSALTPLLGGLLLLLRPART